MWYKNDLGDGYESNKAGSNSGGCPEWVPSPELTWHRPLGPGSSICGERRLSTVSDSGDTGIGTYCSDSLEDDFNSSSTRLSFQPLTHHHLGQDEDVIPCLYAKPPPSSSPYTIVRKTASPSNTRCWSRSCQLLTPALSPVGAPSCLDMKDNEPIRRWSSLTKLSSGTDRTSVRTLGSQYNLDSQGSLDRNLLNGYRKEPLSSNTDHYLPLSTSLHCHSLLQCSPSARPCYQFNHCSRSPGLETDFSLSSTLSSPVKHSSLDMNYSVLQGNKLNSGGRQVHDLCLPKQEVSPLGHLRARDSQIQTAVRTKMWLTEQMDYMPKGEQGCKFQIACSGTEDYCAEGLAAVSPWKPGHQPEPGIKQMVMGTSLPVETLVKVKEGLLRQREVEIDRQKQQIMQLHARIKENEMRAQQVLQTQKGWFEDPYFNTKDSLMGVPRIKQSDEDFGRKLIVADLEVLHLNRFFKQVTQKYTEDIRKLEEKIKTRDRYISSLKKKCQRDNEQNQEKKQRIETLEKYLCDLPTLDEVQVQSHQQEEVQKKEKDLEKTMNRLQMSLSEGYALMKEKNINIEIQTRREKELIATVNGLQKKVQLCLDDGVRLPVEDLKQLEVENNQLLKQQDYSCKLIEHQQEQIERLTSQLTKKLQLDQGLLASSLSHVEIPEVAQLLKEMSLCLLDLQALCNILTQRGQGKEPNLSLLLGMKSLSVSMEESDCKVVVEEELRVKLMEVNQLRKDIDDLRKSISERYSQYMDDTCVSQ